MNERPVLELEEATRAFAAFWLGKVIRESDMAPKPRAVPIGARVLVDVLDSSRLERTFLAVGSHFPDDAGVLLVRFEEAGDRLRVSAKTVCRLVESGALPAVSIGRSRRIRVRDLETYVDNLKGETSGD